MKRACFCHKIVFSFSKVKYQDILVIKIPVFVLLLFLSVVHSYSQNTVDDSPRQQAAFQNDICLPGTLYMLKGTQNNIFVEPLIKRWRPYEDVVRFSGTTKYSRRLQRVASIIEPVEGSTVHLDLVNLDHFKTIKTLTSIIKVGTPGIGNDSTIVSIIGDSFTQGAFFKDALLVKDYVPKIKLIGLRDVIGYPGQADEGRGGWTLDKYFTVSKNRTDAYNGFWQPEGDYKFWGATDFWKLANAIRLNPEADWTFGEKYNAARYETRSVNFDEKTGYRKNSKKNDIMFDNAQEHYILYDGKKWNRVSYDDFEWSFNYPKYLSMWDLEAPEILVEFLGLNDFRNAGLPGDMDFTIWNRQMEKMIDSYHSTVPDGKFVLMIPSSSCGILDNKDGRFTILQNACMWELRKNIIEVFDGRTDEQIYIVDAAIAIDNLNGTRFLTDSLYTVPYYGYEGDERIKVQVGNPHPYPNYPTMGISLAAFIQRHRISQNKSNTKN